MLPSLSPDDFARKWRGLSLVGAEAARQHLADVCALAGHPPPGQAAPAGAPLELEPGLGCTSDGLPWASALKPGVVAWHFPIAAGAPAEPARAWQRMRRYNAELRQPPLLVAADGQAGLHICTNFADAPRRLLRLSVDELASAEGQRCLRAVFFEPDSLRPRLNSRQITEQLAADVARLAERLACSGPSPAAAHFLVRLVFVLFAEDLGLLPADLVARLAEQTQVHLGGQPRAFAQRLAELFGAMGSGGALGQERIARFGGVFAHGAPEAAALAAAGFDAQSLTLLAKTDLADWSALDLGIFGPLMLRGLDPARRSQLGAAYPLPADLLGGIEPQLMQPLRRRWVEVQGTALKLAGRRDAADGPQRDKLQAQLRGLLTGFAEAIGARRVLDPACGSGNRLVLALGLLLELERQVIALADELGVGRFFPSASPAQLYGAEPNPYARLLAGAGLSMAYLQWLWQHGFNTPAEPVLQTMPHLLPAPAPGWPPADVTLG
jgi:hypothetical protein